MGQLHKLYAESNHTSLVHDETILHCDIQSIKVCIVDDHNLIKEAMVNLVKTFFRVKDVYSVANGKLLMDSIPAQKPDLILLDIRMPVMDGLEASKLILAKYPEIKILILTIGDDEKAMLELLQMGVHGYITKSSDVETVEKAIYQVMDGGYYYCEDVSKSLVGKLRAAQFAPLQGDINWTNVPRLTDKENEVVKLLCAEFDNEKIACQLNISMKTLLVHKQNINKKIGSNGLISLLRYAIKAGLVQY